MVPDLDSPPFSPSASYSSPEERDALQTPLDEDSERHIFSQHVPFLISPSTAHPRDASNLKSRSVDQYGGMSAAMRFPLYPSEPDIACPSPLFPPRARDVTNTPLKIDPFAASFRIAARYDEELYGHSRPPAHLSLGPHSPSLLLKPANSASYAKPSLTRSSLSKYYSLNRDARIYSLRFPPDHQLDKRFVNEYQLGDELGSGGYGFVMTAHHRLEGREVAVKFIIKDKVPEHSWMEAEDFKRPLPTEIIILNFIEHENIVKCLDLYEDSLYFYMVQELHGSPWLKRLQPPKPVLFHNPLPSASSLPSLSPSASGDSITDSEPETPPQLLAELDSHPNLTHLQIIGSDHHLYDNPPRDLLPNKPVMKRHSILQSTARPEFSRRPSHDLFECIEQSKNKRLPEHQARYVFAQVVEAVYYLDTLGITHRDIKDENLVIDKDLKVKLIDFGSAILVDPNEPRPFHSLFFGTTAYAASEILLKQPYQAPPAEIWTLGILLSYLLTGMSPFPTEKDAIEGRIVLNANGRKLSKASLDLMRRCLEPDPNVRAGIHEVRAHQWLIGALDAL